MFDKLHNIFEWDDKVNMEKLKTHRGKFESLKMKEYKNIAAYFIHVDDIINSIIGLRENFDEKFIVQKVIRSIPLIFDPKISSIE